MLNPEVQLSNSSCIFFKAESGKLAIIYQLPHGPLFELAIMT